MVVDDLGGGEQAEDPLPRHGADGAVVPPTTGGAPVLAMAAGGTLGGDRSPASDASASDESSERVPLWNRLPRSIWLM